MSFDFRVWDIANKKMYYSLDFENFTINGEFLTFTTNGGTLIGPMNLCDVIIMNYTGFKDKDGVKAYDGDMIPYFFDDAVLGIIKYGDYRDWNGGKFTRHIGFYVEFSDIKHKNTQRKDLGYWLNNSCISGNFYE